MATRATSPATAARCRKRRTRSLTSPTVTSRPQMSRAGSRITPRTRATMSSRSARRNRKKSGLWPVTSSSGWAMAKPQSTNSSASAHSGSRSRQPGPGAAGPAASPDPASAFSMSLATSFLSAHGERPQPHPAARVVDHEQLQPVLALPVDSIQRQRGELVRRADRLAALGVAALPERLRHPGDHAVDGHRHRRPVRDPGGQADLAAYLGRDQPAARVDPAVLGQLLDPGAAGGCRVDPDLTGAPADQLAVGAELEPARVAAGPDHLVGDAGQGLGLVLGVGELLALAGLGEEPLAGAGPRLLGARLGDPVQLPGHLDAEVL